MGMDLAYQEEIVINSIVTVAHDWKDSILYFFPILAFNSFQLTKMKRCKLAVCK